MKQMAATTITAISTTTGMHSNASILLIHLRIVREYAIELIGDFSHHDLLIIAVAFDTISRNLFIIARLFLLLFAHINNINTINSFNLYLVVSTSTAK